MPSSSGGRLRASFARNRAESAECSPGVISIKTIWPSGRGRSPGFGCAWSGGLEVTIAYLLADQTLFISVDFPAFGRPTIATNPDRYSPFRQLGASALPLFSAVSATSALSV